MTEGISKFISTFFSHSGKNKPLVEEVAKQLCQLGVFPWLDKNELIGGSLSEDLEKAIRYSVSVTCFISEDFTESSWCGREIRWALGGDNAEEFDLSRVFPVYLGPPKELVKKHIFLRDKFLHADGDSVNKLGFYDSERNEDPSPEAVAEEIAKFNYKLLIPENWSDVAIVLDQRGEGPRTGLVRMPYNLTKMGIPCLIFRPNFEERTKGAMVAGDEWRVMARNLRWALSRALGTARGRHCTVRVLGDAQIGLWWLIGAHFNRTTSVDLYGYGKDNILFTNKHQERLIPLTGGDYSRAKLLSNSEMSENQEVFALCVGQNANYSQRVLEHSKDIPVWWIESEIMTESEQAMSLVADVVATVEHLRNKYNAKKVMMFWATAAHVALLAAANLTSHVIQEVYYMEWDHANASYVHLPMQI